MMLDITCLYLCCQSHFDETLRRWEQVEGHQSAFQFLMFEVSSSIIVIYTSYDKVIKNQHAASFKPMFLAVAAYLGKEKIFLHLMHRNHKTAILQECLPEMETTLATKGAMSGCFKNTHTEDSGHVVPSIRASCWGFNSISVLNMVQKTGFRL
ncbi:hypothetical protein RRG08_032885 [Elysia crispata]|uniref:Uncharacterized protein n=1 Tax=Elysia crispata TaxID=231223 RepID=A0AAE1CKR2_9GAST|nr:hypothetical protein RRG08_032885 [Elysia crispata]